MILGIILFLSFLTPWTEKKNLKSIHIFLLIWIYWLIFFNEFSKAAVGMDLNFFGEYLGYLVLGYYMQIIPVKKYRWLFGILQMGLGLTYSYYASIQLSYELKTFSEYKQRYLR
jgi:hypothetical protein